MGGTILPNGTTPNPGGGTSATFWLNLTKVVWASYDVWTPIGYATGVNLTLGGSVTETFTLSCRLAATSCAHPHNITLQEATALGNWPPNVAPCGPYRVLFSVTTSNLPLKLPANGTVTVTLSLRAPQHDQYVASQPADFDFTGELGLILYFSP